MRPSMVLPAQQPAVAVHPAPLHRPPEAPQGSRARLTALRVKSRMRTEREKRERSRHHSHFHQHNHIKIKSKLIVQDTSQETAVSSQNTGNFILGTIGGCTVVMCMMKFGIFVN